MRQILMIFKTFPSRQAVYLGKTAWVKLIAVQITGGAILKMKH